MKTDIGVTFGSLGVLGAKKVPEIAKQAEGMGFKSFWTVEATGTDAFTLLGAASIAAPRHAKHAASATSPGTATATARRCTGSAGTSPRARRRWRRRRGA